MDPITDLSVILGATIGALLHAGMTPDELTEQVAQALQAMAAFESNPALSEPLSDMLATTVMDVLSDNS